MLLLTYLIKKYGIDGEKRFFESIKNITFMKLRKNRIIKNFIGSSLEDSSGRRQRINITFK